jgi:cobalt/nickel transport system permease protein
MIILEGKQPRSFIHQVDPRVRVVAGVCFAVLVCLCREMSVLGVGLGAAVVLVVGARIVNRETTRRLVEVNLFMLLLFVFLPICVPGTPVFRIGGLVWTREGLWRTLAVALKANTVMISFLALVGTMEPPYLGFALSRLRVPSKLVHVLLFMVRYIDVIHHEYHRLFNAMRLRAFRPGCNRHTFRTYGYLIGMLLVRSIDRAERVVEAMKCRGFRDRFYVLARFRLAWADMAFALVFAGGLVALGCMEWI